MACGNGNASLAAARRFCDVTGIDYVPMLLKEARNRTEAEGLDVDFMEGDAENLPFEDASFDVVLSTLGVMFAPDREKAAGELRRVGATSTSYWVPNTTPNDVLLVLKAIADPCHTSPGLSAEMLELMSGTSFEDRLPEPLPEGTRVAHKIGSWETTFSDAGMVFPEGARTADEGYYVVVFSEGVPEGAARETSQDVSLEAHRALAPPTLGDERGVAAQGRRPKTLDLRLPLRYRP